MQVRDAWTKVLQMDELSDVVAHSVPTSRGLAFLDRGDSSEVWLVEDVQRLSALVDEVVELAGRLRTHLDDIAPVT